MFSGQPNLHILDGAFYAHRSWHRKGSPALQSFINLIIDLVERELPSHFVVAWEHEGPTFRHELYDGYKAQRPEQEPELKEHIRDCRRALEALRVPVVAVEGYEGDDVAASYAAQWVEQTGCSAAVHTADKDLLQLVDENVRVVIRQQHHDHDAVLQRMGVAPEQVPDLLALAGDSVDGIPGVPGIGLQTAARYLTIWNDIDTILDNRHTLTEKKREALYEARDELTLFRNLTTVRRDVELPVRPTDTLLVPNRPDLLSFCAQRDLQRVRSLRGYEELCYEMHERVAIMCESGAEENNALETARESMHARALEQIHSLRAQSDDDAQSPLADTTVA